MAVNRFEIAAGYFYRTLVVRTSLGWMVTQQVNENVHSVFVKDPEHSVLPESFKLREDMKEVS